MDLEKSGNYQVIMYPNKMSRERKMDRHARIETLLRHQTSQKKTNSKVMPFFSNPQKWMQGSDKYEVSVKFVQCQYGCPLSCQSYFTLLLLAFLLQLESGLAQSSHSDAFLLKLQKIAKQNIIGQFSLTAVLPKDGIPLL